MVRFGLLRFGLPGGMFGSFRFPAAPFGFGSFPNEIEIQKHTRTADIVEHMPETMPMAYSDTLYACIPGKKLSVVKPHMGAGH